MKRLVSIVALFVLVGLAVPVLAAKNSAVLKFVVLRDSNGKPVRNAEIVLHFIGKDGKIKEDGMELKSHEDGKAQTSGMPYGKLRVQVIAPGFRTYGEDFEINQPIHEIVIKLQKPTGPISIYK
jgi:hypothetical protein